jgi:hypothetical protein
MVFLSGPVGIDPEVCWPILRLHGEQARLPVYGSGKAAKVGGSHEFTSATMLPPDSRLPDGGGAQAMQVKKPSPLVVRTPALLLLLLLVVVITGCGGTAMTTTTADGRAQEAVVLLQAHIAEYLDSTYAHPGDLEQAFVDIGWGGPLSWSSDPDELQGYVRGKLVIVCATPRGLDPIFTGDLEAVYGGQTENRLPQSLMATSPEEVGTVVLLEWSTHQVWSYLDGTEGYRLDCTVQVADFVEKKVVSSALISVPPPRTKPAGTMDETGSRYDAEVGLRAYLQALPAYASSGE